MPSRFSRAPPYLKNVWPIEKKNTFIGSLTLRPNDDIKMRACVVCDSLFFEAATMEVNS